MPDTIDAATADAARQRTRVVVVSEIPTPYRLPLYRRLAEEPGIELEVLFCAASEPDRPWALGEQLEGIPHRVMRGVHPMIRTRRNTFVYEINPEIVSVLTRSRPDVVVIGGYAVFAEQAAIALATIRRIPFVLHSETHLLKKRPSWLTRAKGAVLPPILRQAAGGLAAGSAAADYLAAHGIPRDRIRIFPNTIDVDAYAAAARAARAHAAELRIAYGLPDRFFVFAGRLIEVKGAGDLAAALRLLGDDAPPVVVAGEGPLSEELGALPSVRLLGFQPRERLVELYALAEATLVPSRAETWGVVVNEALACGSPVIATDAVGAVPDLVQDGTNGRVIPASDASALAAALRQRLPRLDPAEGAIAGWNYDFGVEQFLEAIRLARGI